MSPARRRALLGVAVGLGVLLLLSIVPVSLERLPPEAPRSWWWTGLLPHLVGSLLPPVVAVVLAIATQRVLLSLGAAAFVAAILVGGPGPVPVVEKFLVEYVWGAVWDPFHGAILLFTAALLGLVSSATKSGGTHGVVELILGRTQSPRGVRLGTVGMGLAVFFDDYANTAIVGPTMRPVFDRFKLSRAKLAYLIDSTAAPVAGLAVISTWVGAEVGYLQEGAATVGLDDSGYSLFFSALGYRFYCIMSLALVTIVAWTGRDIGPMGRVEALALAGRDPSRPKREESGLQGESQRTPVSRSWLHAVVPIGVVLLIIIAGVYLAGAPADAGLLGPVSFTVWSQAFVAAGDLADGNFLAYLFAAAALAGSVLAVILPAARGALSIKEGTLAWMAGVRGVLPAMAILILAWALSAGTGELQTARYVSTALHGVPAIWIPMAVFMVAGVIAFGTGTSWGTMAILVPTAGAVAFEAGGEVVMLVAMAAVLDGAIFGDHCSPISDTTVLSSLCSSCDHLEHVKTQAPYALLGAGAALVCGYGGVAVGLPLPLCYLLGGVVLWIVIRLAGRVPAASTALGD